MLIRLIAIYFSCVPNDHVHSVFYSGGAHGPIFTYIAFNCILVVSLHDVLAQPTVQGCKYVILVGGFSDNKLVQNRIKNNFTHHDCTVLVPNDAQMSVLIGAVRFGQRPRDVTSRIARVHVLQRHGGAVSEGLP